MVGRVPLAASLLLVAFCQSAMGSEQGQLGIFSSVSLLPSEGTSSCALEAAALPSVKPPCSLQEGGSCGYENLNSSAVSSGGFAGSINSAGPLVAGLPSSGCGSCVQVTCNLVGNQVTHTNCNAFKTCGLCNLITAPKSVSF